MKSSGPTCQRRNAKPVVDMSISPELSRTLTAPPPQSSRSQRRSSSMMLTSWVRSSEYFIVNP